jgi:hypothetical protein
MLSSEAMMSFIFALTSPFVQLHFIKLVSPTIYTISTLLTTIFCAITQTILKDQKRRIIFKKYLALVMITDVIVMIIVNYFGLNDANIRFLGITVLNSFAVVIWITIMSDILNNALSKDKLTDFQVLRQSIGSWATACGGGLAVLLSYLQVEWIIGAIILQCVGNLVFAICDYNVFKQLQINNIIH